MDYDFRAIESKWRSFWAENKTYKVEENEKPKFYVLDMFPYPSGAGLHVGHPLGYIASDVFSRYKKLKGFNVLHPSGYDSFGLPAEQYAIQTGQHPAITTENNITRYREQLDKIGFCFDWDREVRTSDPSYYKWTQWIFKQLFDCWYNKESNKADRISTLIEKFESEGNASIKAATDYDTVFTAEEWKAFSEKEQSDVLQQYRLTYLDDAWVNWCPALGTVLANDEIKDGLSERGGHPVEQKLMRQWMMRITAYANRLIEGLDKIDWTDSIKDQQRNWIGKSKGASIRFKVDGHDEEIEVFTTRPDTIFGVSFMTLAPEHELVSKITTSECKDKVEAYVKAASLKSERDRQSDVKNITGEFIGAYAINPISGDKVPIWIGDYVLASYGTGAVMAVPCGDQRDYDFAKEFGIEIKNVFKDVDISEQACDDKSAIIANSDFLNDLPAKKAIGEAIKKIHELGVGKGKTQFRLRDAVFSRQRYWGEPFPVYYENNIPKMVPDDRLPVELPEVDKYLPTDDGEPPLARAKKEDWPTSMGDRMEFNTMPGWAGSSWYFMRYTDPNNEKEFVSKEKIDYWGNVDLYIGGSEHATGHLLYSRFWTKFLHDLDYIPFDEPFQKMINQGMILGSSSFVYRLELTSYFIPGITDSNELPSVREFPEIFVSKEIYDDWADNEKLNKHYVQVERKLESVLNRLIPGDISQLLSNVQWTYSFTKLHADISLVDNQVLDTEGFKNWRRDYKDAEFILNNDGKYICGSEVEKMSKSKFNVQTPDELVEKFGADTLRLYEMFLGPLEQSKPWDTKGINGVHNFLRKLWRLFHDQENQLAISEDEPNEKELKTLHKTIKKIQEDLDRYSFNTAVSNFMIAVNELTDYKCNKKAILEPLLILISPYAPHICEELWEKIGNDAGSITRADFPKFEEKFLVEANYAYPVSFNGKMRFKLELPTNLSKEDVEKEVLASDLSAKYLEGKAPKKVIVVPGKIVNVVV